MRVTFSRLHRSIDSHNLSKIDPNTLTPDERVVINRILHWQQGVTSFEFHTSGSTGSPKSVIHHRSTLDYSARATLEYLGIKKGGTALLCIDPRFIGGTMVIVRALINEMDLTIAPPSRKPHLENSYQLSSMVPLQVHELMHSDNSLLKRIEHLLIGGAKLDISLEQGLVDEGLSGSTHLTFGMTETASHIALRTPGERYFSLLGDTQIRYAENNCLSIKGTLTNQEWLPTNDLVRIVSDAQFEWLGRHDLVINSGGFKLHPERIEATLMMNHPEHKFLLTAVPDEQLGERAILLCEHDAPDELDVSGLHPYEKPKLIIAVPDFTYTDSGKINRHATKKKWGELIR